jgi:Fur family iron response transcriptional regulator
MDTTEVRRRLEARGIQPSAQRVAVAEFVLDTGAHASADEVLAAVSAAGASLSRATVYNTLNLFVEKGLLRQLVIAEGRVVFDPRTAPHHHFVDDDTGDIEDVDYDAVAVEQRAPLAGMAVREMQVVLRGRKQQT